MARASGLRKDAGNSGADLALDLAKDEHGKNRSGLELDSLTDPNGVRVNVDNASTYITPKNQIAAHPGGLAMAATSTALSGGNLLLADPDVSSENAFDLSDPSAITINTSGLYAVAASLFWLYGGTYSYPPSPGMASSAYLSEVRADHTGPFTTHYKVFGGSQHKYGDGPWGWAQRRFGADDGPLDPSSEFDTFQPEYLWLGTPATYEAYAPGFARTRLVFHKFDMGGPYYSVDAGPFYPPEDGTGWEVAAEFPFVDDGCAFWFNIPFSGAAAEAVPFTYDSRFGPGSVMTSGSIYWNAERIWQEWQDIHGPLPIDPNFDLGWSLRLTNNGSDMILPVQRYTEKGKWGPSTYISGPDPHLQTRYVGPLLKGDVLRFPVSPSGFTARVSAHLVKGATP